MKKLALLLLLLFTSCASYFDNYPDAQREYFKLKINKDFNLYTALDRIPGHAEGYYWYNQKFEIHLPKQLRCIQTLGDDEFFEYDDKQIILINAGYQNYNQRPENWSFQEKDKFLEEALSSYMHEKKYPENLLEKPKRNRITKVYTNGEVRILLFNIKPENIDYYMSCIKEFKYLGEFKKYQEMNEVAKFQFHTGHNQFYIADRGSKGDTGSPEFWNDVSSADRLAVGKGILGVVTECNAVVGELILFEKPNDIIHYGTYDHIVEAGIEIKSGTLQILDCPFSRIELEINVEPGFYGVRTYVKHFDTAVDEEGVDEYKIEIWPDKNIERKVLKRSFQE